MMEHHLEPKYLVRVAQLEQLHPPAFRFLSRLRQTGPEQGLWMSTVTNAHVYKHGAFLMYVKVQGPKPEPDSIVLSPDYNKDIAQDASPESHLLFPRAMEKLIMAHRGFSTKWARRTNRGEMVIKPNAPDAFFDALLVQLGAIDVPSEEP